MNPHLNQERAGILAGRINKAAKERLSQWPREDKMLPVVELDVNWVRFSTLNHRTKAERLKMIRDRNDPNLFDHDPLGAAAQDAQFQLLKEHQGFDDIKKDLAERGQREAAVVTAEGVLINGNRRTAALRELLHADKHLDARYVRAFVLPADATAEEIRLLEAELQVSKTFLEDYSWINRGFLIEELLTENGQDFELVAKLMRMSVKEVREESQTFKQVDQLVALSGHTYLHVDFIPHESAFQELAKHIANKAPAETKAVRSTYFLGTLAGCRYRDLRHLRRADVLDYVDEEIDGDPVLKQAVEALGQQSGGSGDLNALLDDALGPQTQTSRVENLLGFLANKKADATVSIAGENVAVEVLLKRVNTAVTQAAQDAKADDDDEKTVQGPIKYIRDAYEKVTRARSGLEQARALPDWNEATFKKVAEELTSAAATLEKM